MNMGNEKVKEMIFSDDFYITEEALEYLKTKTEKPTSRSKPWCNMVFDKKDGKLRVGCAAKDGCNVCVLLTSPEEISCQCAP